jgi:ketosteroid isomerase-like protein
MDPIARHEAQEQVYRVANAFVRGLTEGASLDPAVVADTRIWVSGSKWWSGDLTPERAAAVQARFHGCFVGGRDAVAKTVRSIIAGERQAVVEMSQRGLWFDGRTYDLPFVLVLDIEDGRVTQVREYIADDEFFGCVHEMEG